MLTKFPITKLTICLSSALLFTALWAFIAAQGWAGGASTTTSYVDQTWPTPPPSATAQPVIVHRVNVIRRVHVIDTSGSVAAALLPGASAPPAQAPVPAAPPPAQPPAAAPAPAPAPQPQPAPVTQTRPT